MKKTYEHILKSLVGVVNESAFNLQRGQTVHKDEFDDDEVSVDLIKETQRKYIAKRRCIPIMEKFMNNQEITPDEVKTWIENIGYLLKPIYRIDIYLSIDELKLKDIIRKAIDLFGNECDLNWIDTSNITYMGKLFSEERACFNGDISKWDVSRVDVMAYMFKDSKFNGDISNWKVGNVVNMNNMFENSVFNGDIRRWDVSKVSRMNSMFKNSKFNNDIYSWNVSHVEEMEDMFYNSNFDRDISNWNLSSLKKKKSMFLGCPIKALDKPMALLNLFESAFNLQRRQTVHKDEFDDDEVPAEDIRYTEIRYRLNKLAYKIIDKSITDDEVEYFLNNISVFYNEPFFKPISNYELWCLISQYRNHWGNYKYVHQTINETELDLNWIDVSHMTDLSYVFNHECYPINVSRWDVSNVTNMKGLFLKSNFDIDIDINDWDVSNVKDMSYMFEESNFNGDISNWDVSNVETMGSMFYKSKFNNDISDWDVSKVKNMKCMFSSSHFNQDISRWNVRNVDNMQAMFSASEFNGNIREWILSNLINMQQMFEHSKFMGDISRWYMPKLKFKAYVFEGTKNPKSHWPKLLLNK